MQIPVDSWFIGLPLEVGRLNQPGPPKMCQKMLFSKDGTKVFVVMEIPILQEMIGLHGRTEAKSWNELFRFRRFRWVGIFDFGWKKLAYSLQVSHEKNPYYFPLYWLVNRDPYNGLWKSLYNWVGFHPIYNLNNQGPYVSLLKLFLATLSFSASQGHTSQKDRTSRLVGYTSIPVLGSGAIYVYIPCKFVPREGVIPVS